MARVNIAAEWTAGTLAQACWRQGVRVVRRLLNLAQQWPYPILALLLLTGCGDDIDRRALLDLPVHTTAAYGLSYSVADDVPADVATIGLFLDRDWYLWTQCMAAHYPEIDTDVELIRPFRHIIVPTSFECVYYTNPFGGDCSGEYHRSPPTIYLAYESRHGAPFLTDWHEWRDILDPAREDTDGRCNREI